MNRNRARRPSRFHLERLEDRVTPTTGFGSLEVDASQYIADRLLITLDEMGPTIPLSMLGESSVARGVESLGLGVYAIDLVDGVSLQAASEFYDSLGGVISTEPDYLVSVARTPNDPQFGSLYGMTKIAAPAAWDIQTGNGRTVVAVIDTGVDYTHPDLAANIWRNSDEVAGNGIDDDGNGFIDDLRGWDFVTNDNDPMDDNGHGTHVAGTIGAVGNNGVGVAGVAWTTTIMPLKFLDASGSGSLSAAVRAIDYAVQNGARVSNNSWGSSGTSSTLGSAIQRAQTAGHIFVAAAGNSNQDNDVSASYPANYSRTYDNVVAVAAVDSNDNRAGFSSYGDQSVSLAAPGVSTLSTWPGNRYASLSGTSMATPHVAGAIALLWDQNPSLTYQEVIAKLESSVDVLPQLTGLVKTNGRLNVARMLQNAGDPPPPPADTTGARVIASSFEGTSTSISGLRVTFSEAIDSASFTTNDVVLTLPSGQTLAVASVSPVANSGDTEFVIAFTAQTAPGTYSLSVGPGIADRAGNLMNQDGDSANGESSDDRFSTSKTIQAPPTDTTGAHITRGIVSGPAAERYNRIRVTFSETIALETFTTGDVAMTGPNGRVVAITSVTAVAGTSGREFDIVFETQSEVGRYDIRVGPAIADLAGNPMNQDRDAVNGESTDAYSASFTIKAPPDRKGAKAKLGQFSSSTPGAIDRFRIEFDEAILASTFTPSDVVLISASGRIVPISAVRPVAGSSTTFELEFAGQTRSGLYAIMIGPAINDLAGNPMNQDGDAVNGETIQDAFTAFEVINPARLRVSTLSTVDFAPATSPVANAILDTVGLPTEQSPIVSLTSRRPPIAVKVGSWSRSFR
ncbi:MAG: S8 family serine peptidase [Isosphaeraceae bacterium]|nr:S8 family serine peptidase [Isosphaeraceae bacterium]